MKGEGCVINDEGPSPGPSLRGLSPWRIVGRCRRGIGESLSNYRFAAGVVEYSAVAGSTLISSRRGLRSLDGWVFWPHGNRSDCCAPRRLEVSGVCLSSFDEKCDDRRSRKRKGLMSKDPSKIKRCPECKRLVDASTMRPLSRTPHGGSVRYACPECFSRVMALRKATREAHR